MVARFDAMAAATFGAVADVFGTLGTWTPHAGGEAQAGRVLFNEPSGDRKLLGVDYQADDQPFAEYCAGTLDGLEESVRAGGREEIVIDGRRFGVEEVTRVHDGRTFRAKLLELTEA